MVPWLAASTPNAPYKALTMHMDVSTLPATTDAGGSGFNMEAGGITILIGLRQPALSGISSFTSVRKTYSTAATAIDAGALKLLVNCADEPVKSTVTDSRSSWIRIAT